MSLIDILPHPSVINILNELLFTRDILSLTQVCKWTYNQWALMSCYEVGFNLAQRVYEKYKWRYAGKVPCSLWLRKRVAKCVILVFEPLPKDEPRLVYWWVWTEN